VAIDIDSRTPRTDRLHDLATRFVVGPDNYRFLERLLATPSGTWQTLPALCAGVIDVPAEFAGPQGEVLVAWMPLRGDQAGTRTRVVLITLLHERAAWSEQVSYSGYVGPRHRAPVT
jgi:hypothetical protein